MTAPADHARLAQLQAALGFWQSRMVDCQHPALAEFYRKHAADVGRQIAALEEKIRREEARKDA